MIKNFEHQRISPEVLKVKTIQGLYPEKNCCESFWTLKVKVDLAIFRDHTEKGDKTK